MKVTVQKKDGAKFSYDDVIRIDDYEGIILVHRKDGTPRSEKRLDIERITVDFLLPKPEAIPYRMGFRKLSLD